MKIKYTKRQALQDCLKLWEWLAANPEKGKDDYPHFKFLYANDCPCCHFVASRKDPLNLKAAMEANDEEVSMECAYKEAAWDQKQESVSEFDDWIALCPLKHLWPEGCGADNSPYADWADAHCDKHYPKKKTAALVIANACRKALK